MAAPIVTGQVAVLHQMWPHMKGENLVKLVTTTADKDITGYDVNIHGQGIVDFDDPRELEALASGLPDNVKSGTRVLPNRQKLQLQADAKGAMIRQQQQAKNDRRKQATIDHNATTMREDPRMAEIKKAFNDTSDLRKDGVLWNGLDESQKQQMVRNYYMNETNSSQKRQKLQDIAGEDALVGNIYKDGKFQAGDANYATDEYFANKKGFNKVQMNKFNKEIEKEIEKLSKKSKFILEQSKFLESN